MANLVILDVNAADSRTIKARFSDNLAKDITASNVIVKSKEIGIPDTTVLGVSISEDIITINVLPMTPYTRYNVIFQSTNAIKFRNLQENSFLIEDGTNNVVKIVSAENPTNQTRDYLALALGGNDGVYDLSRETFLRKILNSLSDNIEKARSDIRQTKNENYLRLVIKDEQKTRKFGPWDRLNQEGAYKILRVGTQPTNSIPINGIISFTLFPHDPISLQMIDIENEKLSAGISSQTYDGGTLILTVNNYPVIKLNSVQIQYENGNIYNYDIESLGYRIKNPTYDSIYGRRLITLSDNQFKLNESLLDDISFIIPGGRDKIIINYSYKDLGINVDSATVNVTQVVNIIRETAPAQSVTFSILNAPIVTNTDIICTKNGVQFLNPYSQTPFLDIHPAFLREIPYREGGLPKNPGEYSIDYNTGRVFVYGESINDGTGNFPPAMTYNYRQTYTSKLDYTYVSDRLDLVASPLRLLIGQSAKITFNYEHNLVPDQDYVAKVHEESRNERINNRLATLNSIYCLNSPITNVFRIYNETTGELYTPIRFSKNKVYFNYVNPPNIKDASRERSSFQDVLNEQLIIESEFSNILGTRILKYRVLNVNIISATEDCIGSSLNTSVSFSRSDIFTKELYYDYQTLSEQNNTNRLLIGEYQINYKLGLIYVGVSNSETVSVGTITYKAPYISPINPHVISVSEVYNSLGQNQGISKRFDYSSFDEGSIVPIDLDISDERFTNNDISNPYIYNSGTITVTDDIKVLRGLYDGYDLNNHTNPINFAETTTTNANVITLLSEGITLSDRVTVGSGLTLSIPFISNGINVGSALSAIRISDGYQLVDGYQTVIGNVITLSLISGAVVGDVVDVVYTVILNGASTPIVDYNRGDLFVDYSYLADEILVTYEWGENVIDFRKSTTINVGETYYVSYIVGALRDSLLKNFSSLVQIKELQAFDEDIDREIFRHCLIGAMQTFTKGPTIPAMKQLVSEITEIEPEIVESLFNSWTLGTSYLEKLEPKLLGAASLVSGVFNQGLLAQNTGDAVTIPISSNLRLEEGTLEMFVIPQWDGLDNDAALTFNIKKDGYQISANNIYIGALSKNPQLDENGSFSISRMNGDAIGLPAFIFTKVGVFIYYDIDNKQWKILAKDIPGVSGSVYSGEIATSGSFYDVKFIPNLSELSDVLRSGKKTIEFEFHLDSYDQASPDGYSTLDGYIPGFSFDGIQFMSDNDHYLFDFGADENKNRFSLYKDGRGYLVFEIWDRGGFGNTQPNRKNLYQVSANIENWKASEKHHVAISWVLNSSDNKDEMHLYIDGLEVPNIAKYGNIPEIITSNRFATVIPEQVSGTVLKNTIAGNDLSTVMGSSIVTSISNNFITSGIIIGDTIEVLEQGFTTYTIISVSPQVLLLSSPMPATLSNARFSVNPISFIVSSEIDIYKNIGVYIKYGSGSEVEIPGTRAQIPSYSIERNTLNQRVLKVLGKANVGDIILIKTFGLNHRRCRDNIYLWTNGQSTIKTGLPSPINLDDVKITAILLQLTLIGPSNSIYGSGQFTATLNQISQPTSGVEGRRLSIRVTGGNVDFSNPVVVTINGTSTGGVTQVLTFTGPGKQTTGSVKWNTISSIVINATPIVPGIDSCGVEVRELYSVTEPDGNTQYAVIRFAYQTQTSTTLQGDGSDFVFDLDGFFLQSDVGNLLQITSPGGISGIYTIEEKIDSHTVRLNQIIGGVPFTGATYNCFSISIGRSGFQNGFFFLEQAGLTNVSYGLPLGWYEVDYATNLFAPFDPIDNINAFIGNDLTLSKPSNAIIDEFRILNRQLTDTRIGEVLSEGEDSITINASAFSPFIKNQNTLVLFHFDDLPLKNDTDFYKFANKEYLQSGYSVNSRFGHSLVVKDKGIIFDNKGLLTTNSEGLIEFWVSPRHDTYNDPNFRVYFDAAANAVENVTSITKGIVKISGKTNRIISVKLASDISGSDYFAGGTINSDGQTLTLNRPLPFQQTPVVVSYIPTGTSGDRITIIQDSEGYIDFTVVATGSQYTIRHPVFWPSNTWHRIRASFKFNRADNKDEIRLFIDGEEKGVLLFGQSNVTFGENFIFGQRSVLTNSEGLVTDINFNDLITQFSLGQDFAGANGAQARFDNLKISNKSITPFLINGQPMDVYYNTNVDYIYPSIQDAFTTFLFNFDDLIVKINDFSILRDSIYGLFNFDLNIIDSFDIVLGDSKVQTILEAMINALKPAISKVNISYIK